MKLEYLKFMRKWIVSYRGKARAVGNTQAEAIDQACELLKLKIIK